FHHSLVRRKPMDGCSRLRLVIHVAEFMDADQVEGVQQLSSGRVRAVERVSKAAVIVNDQTARRASFFVCIPPVVVFLVNIRKESLYCRLHVIGATENADPTLFLQRVALALRLSGPGL